MYAASSQKANCQTLCLDGMPSLVPRSELSTDIVPKLQAKISERVDVFRFVNLTPTFSKCTRPESRRLHLVSATAPVRSWLRTRLRMAASASCVTNSMSTTTPYFASRYVASSVYPHPASSPLFKPLVLGLLAISRFKLCGVH
jgi:hypothetical protein